MGRVQMVILILALGVLSLLSGILYIEIRDGAKEESKVQSDEAPLQEKAELDENTDRDNIKIGLILALTGIKSNSDRGALEGAALAVENLNAEGGALGKAFELLLLDNRGTPLGSRKAAEEAISIGVTAVVGPERSSYALATAPLLQEAGIPMIAHLATHTEVTKVGDYIFRACYTDEFQGEKLGTYAAEELKSENAVVLRMVDEDYSLELSEYFKKQYELLGGRVEWIGNYKAKDMDYSDIIKKVKEVDPELVFIAGYTKDIGLIIRQAELMGVDTQFLAGDGVGSFVYNFGGAAVDGLKSATHWHESVEYKENMNLMESYTEKYKKPMADSESVALAYDSVMLLGEAIKRGDTLDREIIKRELFGIDDFEGATGVYDFDENGDLLDKELVVIEFKGGKRELVKEYRAR